MSDTPSTPAHRANVPRTLPNIPRIQPQTGARTATGGQRDSLRGTARKLSF